MTIRRLSTALAFALCAVALPACGSSSSDSGGSGGSAEAKQERARVQLTSCLREQGIDIPDRPGGAGDSRSSDDDGPARPTRIDREKLDEAIEGPCKKYRDQAFGEVSAEDRAEARDQMLKFSSCMREHGVDLPDPGQGRMDIQIDRDDPQLRKAEEACRKLLPGGGRAGPNMIGPGPGR